MKSKKVIAKDNPSSNTIDGLDALCFLFENEDAFVEHIVEHTLFSIARFTSNANYFLQYAVKTLTPRFKNKREAVKFTKYGYDPDGHIDETKCLFHRETKIRVKIDVDGNYTPKWANILSSTIFH